MTKKMISLLLVIACANIAYATEFINFKRSSIYDVELTGTSDTITYDPLDWKGVRMAVENLRHDLKAVLWVMAPHWNMTSTSHSILFNYYLQEYLKEKRKHFFR